MALDEKIPVTDTDELTREQEEHLRRLEASAQSTETIAETVEGTGQGVSDILPLKDEIANLITMAVSVLAPAMPSVAALYTPQTIQVASGAVSAVCEKHGWMQGGLMGEWGVEISAAVVLIPLAISTRAAVMADIEMQRIKAGASSKKEEPKKQDEFLKNEAPLNVAAPVLA